ncbi:hypothetical protein LV79_004951 [Actinokineospora globicatena]|nr:hypothetical protein [Actinokineospora globicatena]GLW80715.1 hypothetical protein Aglo01_51960 [Actinokineospora globicatena]GLW87542.1 hypothetical protein Aglo02_51810 [Actinokineospora globicatena]
MLLLAIAHLMSGPWTKGDAAWSREWTGLAEWSRYLLMFVWPLVLGAGAWQGARDTRSDMDELLATVPSSRWRRAVPVASAVAIGVTAGYLGVVAVGAVRVIASGAALRADWLVVALLGALALVAVALLGLGIGRLLPSVMTPPVAAVAGLAVQVVLVWRSQESTTALLFTPAVSGGGVSVFTQVAPRASTGQALWFLMLAASGLVLFAGTRLRALAAVPLAVGATVLALVVPHGSPVHVPDARALSLVCEPRVCVTEARKTRLTELRGPSAQALADLAVLPNAPTTVVEHPTSPHLPRTPGEPDTLGIDLGDPAFRRGGPAELRRALLAGAGTQACATDDSTYADVERETVARTVTAGWFVDDLQPLPGHSYIWAEAQDLIQRTWADLRALPRAEQVTRVAAVRSAGLRCEGDLLTVLTEK